ncbi:MAG: hypothetical protein GY705_02345 [Bacteroidetes bacterium]|nr:hypothetical protein [Bacteroidota bacterium]
MNKYDRKLNSVLLRKKQESTIRQIEAELLQIIELEIALLKKNERADLLLIQRGGRRSEPAGIASKAHTLPTDITNNKF